MSNYEALTNSIYNAIAPVSAANYPNNLFLQHQDSVAFTEKLVNTGDIDQAIQAIYINSYTLRQAVERGTCFPDDQAYLNLWKHIFHLHTTTWEKELKQS
jgi:hypothetical protein